MEYNGTVETAGRQYITQDHLGSTRLLTSSTGAVVQRFDCLSFGDELPAGVGARTTGMNYASLNASGYLPMRFTGKERDMETAGSANPSGLDYFWARYFPGAQGRFTSPDRPFLDWDLTDPQSWNLYGYVRNNPLRYTDPDGEACVVDRDGKEHDDNSGGQSCADAHKKSENDKPSVTVTAQQGSLWAFLTAPQVARYVPNDTALPDSSRQVFSQVYNNTQFLNPCGGGAFAFAGRDLGHVGPVHVEGLALANLDSEEGLSAGALVEGAVGPAAVGIEGMYSFRTGKPSVSGLGFANKEFRAKGEGPRRRGFGGAKDSTKLDAVFAGALVDPAKGEFGGYVSLGAIGAGAYVSYSFH